MAKRDFWQAVIFNGETPSITGTAGLELPRGTTGERPLNPDPGTVRYNTELAVGEIFQGGNWVPIILEDATSFDSIPELRSFELRPAYVIVFGAVGPNSGGGGLYRWVAGDSTPADQVDIVSPLVGPPGRWFRTPMGSPSSIDSSRFSNHDVSGDKTSWQRERFDTGFWCESLRVDRLRCQRSPWCGD